MASATGEALHDRDRRFLRRWPAPLARRVQRARRRREHAGARIPERPAAPPYWAILPCSLVDAHDGGDRREHRRLLRDVLWGQYCLFQVFRLQDDVFDRHSDDAVLVYAADRYFVEACRAFAACFPLSSPFWEALYDAVETTADAVVRVDAIQRSGSRRPAHLLNMYARVDSIFTVGFIAICMTYRRHAAIGRLREIARRMAIAGQILDDLEDLVADARASRLNYVARLLLTPREARVARGRPERLLRLLAPKMVRADGASMALARVDAELRSAQELAERLRLPVLDAHLSAGRASIRLIEAELRRRQVAILLGPALAARRRIASPPPQRSPRRYRAIRAARRVLHADFMPEAVGRLGTATPAS
jgi:hypothetical protein